MLRRLIRNYFGFSSAETNGFIILLPLMAMFIFSEPVYRWWFIAHSDKREQNSPKLDSLMAILTSPSSDALEVKITGPENLDPNNATEADFISAGITQKVAQRILRYRLKGGKFKNRKDFAKIYGIDSSIVRRLGPSLIFPTAIAVIRESTASFKTENRQKKERIKFDLNEADSTQLMSLYGIGSKLSARILKYRERLGGFISMDQLYEIYGLDSAVVNKLKITSFIAGGFVPRQVAVNIADQKQLTKIPYLKYGVANAIVAWRFQHGKLKSIDDLRQIVVIDTLTFQKIKPYLTVNE